MVFGEKRVFGTIARKRVSSEHLCDWRRGSSRRCVALQSEMVEVGHYREGLNDKMRGESESNMLSAPPRLLLGVAFLFWGGMHDHAVAGLIAAVLIEGRH